MIIDRVIPLHYIIKQEHLVIKMILKFYLYCTTASVTIHTSGDAWPMAFFWSKVVLYSNVSTECLN